MEKTSDSSRANQTKVARTSKSLATAKPSSTVQDNKGDLSNGGIPKTTCNDEARIFHTRQEQSNTMSKLETLRRTHDNEQPKNDVGNNDDNDNEAMSQTMMEELFGSYEESEQEGNLDRCELFVDQSIRLFC